MVDKENTGDSNSVSRSFASGLRSAQTTVSPLVILGWDDSIVSCSRALLEIYDCSHDAILGHHWNVLCAEEDVAQVLEINSKPIESDVPFRLHIALRVVDSFKVAEIEMIPFTGGGSLWIYSRVSTSNFPPLSTRGLLMLQGHYRHSLRGQLTLASTLIQLLQTTSLSNEDNAGNRRCKQALNTLSSLNELID